jgi:D-3-phosphoglycerate dehydrogenase
MEDTCYGKGGRRWSGVIPQRSRRRIDGKDRHARDELKAALADGVDGILTRSGTTMDQEMIEAGTSLRVIGRAGVGVDNINIPAASRRGIIVINAPSGNTLAATELTIANMLAVVRKIPQACNSLHRGEWDRARFTGRQLSGKKLLIIGLGRIGSAVAIRCRAFGMEVSAYDPYITTKKADSLRVSLISDLEDAVSLADFVTIHTPLTAETKNMINEELLRAFKTGAYLVNCARGGLVDEKAVAEAVRDGRLRGFATDVYTKEPLPPDHPFLAEDIAEKIVITPHIGANTEEAQSEVSRIAAENMLAALRGEPYANAVNLPFMEQDLNSEQKMYLDMARKMGIITGKVAKARCEAVHNCHVMLRGSLFDEEENTRKNELRPYTVAVLKGMLEVSLGKDVNYMIAPLLAKDRHISVDEGTGETKTYKNTIGVELETEKGLVKTRGTITEDGRQRIIKLNDYWIDFVPNGKMLIFQNHDRPGVIGKIGKVLGDAKVNIANFSLGRKEGSGLALGVLEFDGEMGDELLDSMLKSGDMLWIVSVDFSGND